MEKNEINLQEIKFRCLKSEEIPKCVELISETFALFDPFIIFLGLKKEDLRDLVQEDLSKLISDKLVTVALDINQNIIGCYAGFKLIKIPELNLIKQRKVSFNIKTKEIINKEQKLNILEDIDNNLIHSRFIMHLKNNELETTCFCDYFCVSADYFQTNLAKTLAENFFINCKMQGIRHIYGSLYNIKAISIMKNNFQAEVGEFNFNFVFYIIHSFITSL